MPVPDGPVYHVTDAPVPATPLAVTWVVADGHMGEAAAVALLIDTFELDATVTLASAGLPQVPVTLA